MENFFIKNTSKTPLVNLNYNQGLIEIKGKSVIENTKTFYDPINFWIDDYIENPREATVVNIALDYYNTSSQMWIFRILKKVVKVTSLKKSLIINWFYMDDDMKEIGEELIEVLQYQVNLIYSPQIFNL